jgi:hypothetical protein
MEYKGNEVSLDYKITAETFWKTFSAHFWKWSQKNDTTTQNLVRACRMYAYHFDTYVNAACRGKLFPLFVVLDRLSYLTEPDNHTGWTMGNYTKVDKNFHPAFRCRFASPFERFQGKKYDEFMVDEYIKIVQEVSQQIDTAFKSFSYFLLTPLTVYRGLAIPVEGGVLDLAVVGYTSTSLSREIANHIATHSMQKHTHRVVVLEINLPVGTNVLSMDICTIQKEYEIVILSQGLLQKLEIQSSDGVIQCELKVSHTHPQTYKLEIQNERDKSKKRKALSSSTSD